MRRPDISALLAAALLAACRAPAPHPVEGAGAAAPEEVRIPVPDGRIPHLVASLYAAGGPGVLLIQGSGPTDRDWNNPLIPGKNGSGAVIARSLARAGFTVLAFDKRGTGGSAEDRAQAPGTGLEDARAALRFLARRGGPLLGVLGHSEGASTAVQVALGEARIGALVLAAAPGRSLRTLLREQVTRNILRPSRVTDPRAIETNLAWVERNVAARRPLPDPPAGVHPKVIELIKLLTSSPRIDDMAARFNDDPARTLARLHTPTLVVGGGRDLQVRRADYDALARAATQGRAVWIPDMDHVLKQERRPVTRLSGEEVVARYGEPRPVHPRLLREACLFFWKQLAGKDGAAICQ